MSTTGSDLLAKALARQGVNALFFLMGAPMRAAQIACIAQGIRLIDVRHEQAAAMMAHAYSRVLGRPGVCMASSGPGTLNLHGGLANALVDCVPVVALGGASNITQFGTGAFQEIDQVAVMRPVVKWAERVYDARRIPEFVDIAFRQTLTGKPGPVYLDFPGDVLYQEVEESEMQWPDPARSLRSRPACDPAYVDEAIRLLASAERPVVISGSGILWSGASAELRSWVEKTGMPFYTTPQGRGVIPEDHEYCYLAARSLAFRGADVVLVAGTRLNYGLNFGMPPRFSSSARFIRIDIDPTEIAASRRAEVDIVGDVRTVLRQLLDAVKGVKPEKFRHWRERLEREAAEKSAAQREMLDSDQVPIHPLRLCREVRDLIDRDAILVVDGQEILSYARQSILSYVPGHRINSGTFGMMGVGMPFAVAAKVAKPDKQVVALHGDGSFGMNCMELDTAVRHGVPVMVVVSLNGGWSADPKQIKPGRNLGYTRFDKVAEALGCHAEYVEQPDQIRPALLRAKAAVADGKTAVVNVVTDWRARAQTMRFTEYST